MSNSCFGDARDCISVSSNMDLSEGTKCISVSSNMDLSEGAKCITVTAICRQDDNIVSDKTCAIMAGEFKLKLDPSCCENLDESIPRVKWVILNDGFSQNPPVSNILHYGCADYPIKGQVENHNPEQFRVSMFISYGDSSQGDIASVSDDGSFEFVIKTNVQQTSVQVMSLRTKKTNDISCGLFGNGGFNWGESQSFEAYKYLCIPREPTPTFRLYDNGVAYYGNDYLNYRSEVCSYGGWAWYEDEKTRAYFENVASELYESNSNWVDVRNGTLWYGTAEVIEYHVPYVGTVVETRWTWVDSGVVVVGKYKYMDLISSGESPSGNCQ